MDDDRNMLTPVNRAPLEGTENVRESIIGKQNDIINLMIGKIEHQPSSVVNASSELINIKYLIENTQTNINYYSATSKLNTETQKAFEEILNGMEATKEELQAELSIAAKRFNKAKHSLFLLIMDGIQQLVFSKICFKDFILDTYYPDMKETILTILKDLEDACSAEDEEGKYREIDPDTQIAPVLMLIKSMCIVSHPSKTNFFKLAPLM